MASFAITHSPRFLAHLEGRKESEGPSYPRAVQRDHGSRTVLVHVNEYVGNDSRGNHQLGIDRIFCLSVLQSLSLAKSVRLDAPTTRRAADLDRVVALPEEVVPAVSR